MKGFSFPSLESGVSFQMTLANCKVLQGHRKFPGYTNTAGNLIQRHIEYNLVAPWNKTNDSMQI